MKPFIVLGAEGQLGTELVRLLPELSTMAYARCDLDICDADAVEATLEKHCPSVVFNCAAYVDVERAEYEKDEAFEVNGYAVKTLALNCCRFDITLVHISTDYVFDGKKEAPYCEVDEPDPISVYGQSKLFGEQSLILHCQKYFLVRSSGLYGASGSRAKGGSFVDRVLKRARAGEKLRVVEDQITSPTWTRDLAAKILELVETRAHGLYHISNAGECSWHEFTEAIMRLSGLDVAVQPVSSSDFATKARRPAYSVLGNTMLRGVSLCQPRHWRDALTDYLAIRMGE